MDFNRKLILLLEIIAAFFAAINFFISVNKKNKVLFIFFLGIVLVELLSFIPYLYYTYPDAIVFKKLRLILGEKLLKSNSWLYNLFNFFWFYMSTLFIRCFIEDRRKVQRINYLLITFFTISIIDIIIHYDVFIKDNLYISIITGSIMFSIAMLIYMLDIMNSYKVLYFYKSFYFWVILLMFMYNLITTPLFIFITKVKFLMSFNWQLLSATNIIFYSTLIIGFALKVFGQKGEKAP